MPYRMADQISAFLDAPLTDRTRQVIGEVREPSDFGRTFAVPRQALSPDELDDVGCALDRFGYGGVDD